MTSWSVEDCWFAAEVPLLEVQAASDATAVTPIQIVIRVRVR
jgi:hypothetical protein